MSSSLTLLEFLKWKESDKKKKDKKQRKDNYSRKKKRSKKGENKLYRGLRWINRNKNNLNFNNSWESSNNKPNNLPL